MFKRIILLGAIAGLLAAIAAIVYQQVYTSFLGADFTLVVKPVNIVIACVLGTLLAAVGYWLLNKWLKDKGEIVFNFVFVILVFASIMGPFSATLPLDIEYPELFPGLTVPIHFFPALAWFTLKPLFIKTHTVIQ